MTDARLRRTETNDILRLIEQLHFSPSEFEWTEVDVKEHKNRIDIYARISVVIHRPTKFFCRFGPVNITFSPGSQYRVEGQPHEDVWGIKLRFSKIWLAELRKEVDAPDLWASIGQEKALSTAASAPDIDNHPFTTKEQRFIAAKLDEIKAFLIEGQQFAADQGEAVEREFAYLKESSKRLGRKDWLNNLLGGIVGLAIGLALDPEKARGLLRLAGTVLQSLWGTGHILLP